MCSYGKFHSGELGRTSASEDGRHGRCFQPNYRMHGPQAADPPQQGPSTPVILKRACVPAPGGHTPRTRGCEDPDSTPRCWAGCASVRTCTHLTCGVFPGGASHTRSCCGRFSGRVSENQEAALGPVVKMGSPA